MVFAELLQQLVKLRIGFSNKAVELNVCSVFTSENRNNILDTYFLIKSFIFYKTHFDFFFKLFRRFTCVYTTLFINKNTVLKCFNTLGLIECTSNQFQIENCLIIDELLTCCAKI